MEFAKTLQERKKQIEKIRKEMKEQKTIEEPATIFHGLLAGDLPESEKEPTRLAEEAQLLVGAATHTTAWALSVATYYLLSQPHTFANLKAELEAAISDPNEPITIAAIEQLPYLTAVIKEGLRLSFGSTSRIPRIAKDIPMDFHGTKIPLGVPVSMAIPEVHLDEKIFPDPYAFHPERWLEDKTRHLERYLVPFTRGPRACVGMNLAWAEMYICLSTVFRRFGTSVVKDSSDFGMMELYETDAEDVALVRDALFPMPKDGSKGVRVKLSK
jgi:cytochrome P450